MRRLMRNGLWTLLLAMPLLVGAGGAVLGPERAHAAGWDSDILYDYDGVGAGGGVGGGSAGYGDPDDPQGPQRPLMARPLSRGPIWTGDSYSHPTVASGRRTGGPDWNQVRTVILSLRFYYLRF